MLCFPGGSVCRGERPSLIARSEPTGRLCRASASRVPIVLYYGTQNGFLIRHTSCLALRHGIPAATEHARCSSFKRDGASNRLLDTCSCYRPQCGGFSFACVRPLAIALKREYRCERSIFEASRLFVLGRAARLSSYSSHLARKEPRRRGVLTTAILTCVTTPIHNFPHVSVHSARFFRYPLMAQHSPRIVRGSSTTERRTWPRSPPTFVGHRSRQ